MHTIATVTFIKTVFEIICLSICCYGISIWLSKDKQHNLLGYAIGYLLCHFGAYFFELPVLATLLWWTMPTIATLFVIVHEQQLQKNLVCPVSESVKHNLPPETFAHEIVQTGVQTTRNKINAIFIIEGLQQIEQLLDTELPLGLALQKNSLSTLCTSSLYKENTAIWLSYSAKLKGLSTVLKKNSQQKIDLTDLQTLCGKTDTVALLYNAQHHWTYINKDKTLEQVNSNHMEIMLKKHLTTFHLQKDMNYVVPTTETRELSPF
ncbi:hypothetical protein IPH25_03535 [bacterium]|nr:MAG: hypothetical protein IPG37_00525 [bacterium]QQR61528.1 MAG: hypothetical protein IPH25_03535 [bacterium]QQR62944.1 MAG: hypothetical protein IPH67_00455 [bacterium]